MTNNILSAAEQERVELAISCSDCDILPRVAHAGETEGDGENAVQIMHNGIRTYCSTHYGHYNVEVIRKLRGVHEPQEERVFYEVMKQIPPGGTILELGSFWAYYSMWFLKDVDHGKAILIEPVPSALDAGKRNFVLNNFEGFFLQAAVSDVCRSKSEIELWKGFSIEAETVTVDSVMEAQDISFLDILHADIQGTEARMLSGAQGALATKRIGWIFISTHSEYVHQVCRQDLRKHGYAIIAEHTPAESHSIDGLIVASSVSSRRILVSRRRTLNSTYSGFRAWLRTRVLEPIGLRTKKI